jgi:hypothetical protein
MKTSDALKIGGIVFAGVAAFLIVNRAIKEGGKVAVAVSEVVKKDLNPASTENIIYKNLPETVQTKVGDFLGWVFDNEGYNRRKTLLENGGTSNVKTQKVQLLPPSGAGAGRSTPEFTRTDPRRLDIVKSYDNPFNGIETMDYNAMGDFPLDFGK